MARIRTIKPEFWTSAQVMDCSAMARLLFIGLWNFADDAGRMAYSPRTVKAQVFPGDDLSIDAVSGMIDDLSKNDLIIRYAVEGKEYLQITGWQHQRIDKPQKSKHPERVEDHSKNIPISFDVGRELKGREGSVADASESAKRVGDLRVAITQAFEAANSANPPDTARAGVWLGQGFDPAIIVAVIRELLAKKPSISTLNYFDSAIREAHEKRNPRPIEKREIDWDYWVARYAKDGSWLPTLGADPGMGGCKCPDVILSKHGIDPRTGQHFPQAAGASA